MNKYLVSYELEIECEANDVNHAQEKLKFLKFNLPPKTKITKINPVTIEKLEPSIDITASGTRTNSLTKMESRIVNTCLGLYIDSNTLIRQVRKMYDNFYGPEVISEVIGKLVSEGVLIVRGS